MSPLRRVCQLLIESYSTTPPVDMYCMSDVANRMPANLLTRPGVKCFVEFLRGNVQADNRFPYILPSSRSLLYVFNLLL